MPFKPGQSGNPRGRPPGPSLAEIWGRKIDPEAAFERLWSIVENTNGAYRARDSIVALELLISHIYGKPLSMIEMTARMAPPARDEREQRQLRVLSDADLEVLAKLDAIADELDVGDGGALALPAPAPELVEAGSDGS